VNINVSTTRDFRLLMEYITKSLFITMIQGLAK